MTNKNQIKQYLQDRLQGLESIKKEREWTTAELGDVACCKQTLAFIDSLQEEPTSNDLEAEFVLYLKRKFNIPQEGHKLKTDGWRPSPYDLLDIAKHFAQWQKEQMVINDNNKKYHRIPSTTLKRLYRNEAKYELLKSDIMEGIVGDFEKGTTHSYLTIKIPMLLCPSNCAKGDKVKLIIVMGE